MFDLYLKRSIPKLTRSVGVARGAKGEAASFSCVVSGMVDNEVRVPLPLK